MSKDYKKAWSVAEADARRAFVRLYGGWDGWLISPQEGLAVKPETDEPLYPSNLKWDIQQAEAKVKAVWITHAHEEAVNRLVRIGEEFQVKTSMPCRWAHLRHYVGNGTFYLHIPTLANETKPFWMVETARGRFLRFVPAKWIKAMPPETEQRKD